MKLINKTKNGVNLFNTVINFDFEEVSSAVYRNAELHALRKSYKGAERRVLVIVPYYFAKLFSNADYIGILNKDVCKRFNIDDYKLITGDTGYRNTTAGVSVMNKFLGGIITNVPPQFKQDKIKKLLYRFYYTGRVRKYYVNSGLEAFCLQRLKKLEPKFEYFRVNDYFDMSSLSVQPFDLGLWLRKNLGYLAQMINDGNLYAVNLSPDELAKKLQLYATESDTKTHLRIFSEFLARKGPKIIFRTRNFATKATVHNSKLELFEGLVQRLLDMGCFVLNLGCPLMNLNIDHTLYREINHRLSFELELALCMAGNACCMTSHAGNYIGFAASAIKMIRIDDELPPHPNFDFLVNARKAVGIIDIDVRQLVKQGKYQEAAIKIMAQITSVPAVSVKIVNRLEPQIVEIGIDGARFKASKQTFAAATIKTDVMQPTSNNALQSRYYKGRCLQIRYSDILIFKSLLEHIFFAMVYFIAKIIWKLNSLFRR